MYVSGGLDALLGVQARCEVNDAYTTRALHGVRASGEGTARSAVSDGSTMRSAGERREHYAESVQAEDRDMAPSYLTLAVKRECAAKESVATRLR